MLGPKLVGALVLGVALFTPMRATAGGPCQGQELCNDPCPAANSCVTNEDCDLGAVCVPECSPSSCDCDSGTWICTEDCLGECSHDTEETCLLAADVGPCDGVCPRFHYDAAAGRCESFVYGCCEGNANNFLTRAACEAACSDGPPPAVPTASTWAAWMLVVVLVAVGGAGCRTRARSELLR